MGIWIPITLVSILSVGLGIASVVHHKRVDNFLEKPLETSEEVRDRLKKHGEETVGVGVTIFDALYETYRLSPEALAGIEHVHHARDFQSFSDLSGYIENELEGGNITKDTIHKYKGYTGEEQVFDKLEDLGYDVEVPDSATNADYDAIVDGQKIDVAITDNPSYIQDKLDTADPDVMIYTNREMAEAFGDHPDVIVDPSISVQEAFHLTEDTFDALADPAAYSDAIPALTLIIASLRQGNRYLKGQVDGSIALEHAIVDGVGIGSGILIGGKIGSEIGAALAGPTGGISLAVGPIAGGIGGAITGRVGAEYYKNRDLRQAVESLEDVAKSFYRKFDERYSILMLRLDLNFEGDLKTLEEIPGEKETIIKRFLFPSVLTKFCTRAKRRLNKDWQHAKEYYQVLANELECEEPERAGLILHAQGPTVLLGDPPLQEKFQDVDNAVDRVEQEKERIGKATEEKILSDNEDPHKMEWQGWYRYEDSLFNPNGKFRMGLDIDFNKEKEEISGVGQDLEEEELEFKLNGSILPDDSVEFSKEYKGGLEIHYEGILDDGVIEGKWEQAGLLGTEGTFKIWRQ